MLDLLACDPDVAVVDVFHLYADRSPKRAAETVRVDRSNRCSLEWGEHMFVKVLILAGMALVVWSAVARPSGAHGHKVSYRVQAYDTLWTIASAHYGGDVRDAVWQIQQANRLTGTAIRPGETLVLP
jgi:nucleoid-associated protein YgaU